MVYLRIKEILEEKKLSKYWFVKNMDRGYRSCSKLIDNDVSSIRFDTLEKVCRILKVTPGELIIIKKEGQ